MADVIVMLIANASLTSQTSPLMEANILAPSKRGCIRPMLLSPLMRVERCRNCFSVFRTLSAPDDTRNKKRVMQICKLFGKEQTYKKRGKKSHDYHAIR